MLDAELFVEEKLSNCKEFRIYATLTTIVKFSNKAYLAETEQALQTSWNVFCAVWSNGVAVNVKHIVSSGSSFENVL